MATRDVARKAGAAAFEKTLLAFLPELEQRLDALRDQINTVQHELRRIDARVDQLRQDMLDKFEQQRETTNELGQRIARVEGKLEEITRGMDRQSDRLDRQSDKMDQWIERVVKVEMTQRARRTRAS